MSEPTSHDVALAMIRFGCMFVQNLGRLLVHADAENAAKIKETWPDYWTAYSNRVPGAWAPRRTLVRE
jgi:hypothetical protein